MHACPYNLYMFKCVPLAVQFGNHGRTRCQYVVVAAMSWKLCLWQMHSSRKPFARLDILSYFLFSLLTPKIHALISMNNMDKTLACACIEHTHKRNVHVCSFHKSPECIAFSSALRVIVVKQKTVCARRTVKRLRPFAITSKPARHPGRYSMFVELARMARKSSDTPNGFPV